MKTSLKLFAFGMCVGFAAWLPAGEAVPTDSLAKKGPSLFADDFARAELGANWHVAVPTFEISDKALKGTQTRDDHGAVIISKVNAKDVVVECRVRFEGANSLALLFNDKSYKGSHAGHICRVQLTPKVVRLVDDKEGMMRNDIFEMNKDSDPTKKAEAKKLAAGRSQEVPMPLEAGKWYNVAMEIVGDEMRLCIDDKPVGYLKSPGLAHETKEEFGVAIGGKSAEVADLKIFSAEYAGKK